MTNILHLMLKMEFSSSTSFTSSLGSGSSSSSAEAGVGAGLDAKSKENGLGEADDPPRSGFAPAEPPKRGFAPAEPPKRGFFPVEPPKRGFVPDERLKRGFVPVEPPRSGLEDSPAGLLKKLDPDPDVVIGLLVIPNVTALVVALLSGVVVDAEPHLKPTVAPPRGLDSSFGSDLASPNEKFGLAASVSDFPASPTFSAASGLLNEKVSPEVGAVGTAPNENRPGLVVPFVSPLAVAEESP
uniref:Uncharacterized protein n=1 Tax=Cacopsylla melanoneura TaxID=428564 RepID=A0A8D8VGD2_9HEMI